MSAAATCSTCIYYRSMVGAWHGKDGPVPGPSECKRFPPHASRDPDDWCGEHRSADAEPVRVSGKVRAPVAPQKPAA